MLSLIAMLNMPTLLLHKSLSDMSDFSSSILSFANDFAKSDKTVIIHVSEARYSVSSFYSTKISSEKRISFLQYRKASNDEEKKMNADKPL